MIIFSVIKDVRERYTYWAEVQEKFADTIKHLYVDKCLTAAAIGRQLNLDDRMVSRVLIDADIKNEGQVGKRSPRWKGGRTKTHQGYIQIRIAKNHPFAIMGRFRGEWGSVLEHRLIMAQHIGRPLESYETVHHKNGVKDDNRVENLQLMVGVHHSGTAICCAECGSRNLIYEEI